MDSPGLFAAEPYTAPLAAEPVERVSADRRRTERQAAAVRAGAHPLGLVVRPIRIHPDADPARTASRENATGRSLRCGTCQHRQAVGGHATDYPKCVWRPASERPNEHGWYSDPPPRYSGGPATDVRAWWPACTDWQPREEA